MAFTTNKTLLAKVRAGDDISWREFYETYRPLIFLVGRDSGLNVCENEELVQLVMCEIFQKDILNRYNPEEVPADITFQYDPKKGRFRHFLKGIIRNQARKLYHRRPKHVVSWTDLETASEGSSGSGSQSPHLLPPSEEDLTGQLDEAKFDSDWEDEWRKLLFSQAMEELRNQVQAITYTAFEMYAVQGRPVKQVAEFLGLSVNSIYVAKSRCIEALKEIITDLEKK